MNQEQALQVWENLYGEATYAYDYASHRMNKEDYGKENSLFGWTIDYKKPLAQGGSYLSENLIPCALVTYHLREGKNSFSIGTHSFEVRKGKRYGTYELYDITDRNHPLNLSPEEFSQDETYNRERKASISGREEKASPVSIPNVQDIYQNTLNQEIKSDEQEESVNAPVSFQNQTPIPLEEEDQKSNEEEVILDNGAAEIKEENVIEEKEPEEMVQEVPQDSLSQEETLPSEEETRETELKDSSSEETQDLKNQLEEKETQNQKLQDTISEKEAQIQKDKQDYEKQIADITSQKESLLKEKQQEQEEIKRIEEEKDKLSQDLISCKAEKESLEKEKQAWIEEKKQKESDVSSLQESLKKKEDEIAFLNQQIFSKNQDEKGNSETIASLNQELVELKEKLAAKESEKEALQKSLDDKEKERAALDQEKNGLNEKIHGLETTIQEKTDQVSSLTEEKNSKEADLQEKENTLKTRDDLIEGLKSQIAELKNSEAEQKEKYQSVFDEKEHLISEKNELEEKYQTLSQSQKDLEQEKEHLEAGKVTLEAEKQSLNDQLEEQKKNIEEQKEQNEKDLVSLHETLADLNRQINDLEKKEILLEAGVSKEHCAEAEELLSQQGLPYNIESVNQILIQNPQWLRKENGEIHDVPSPIAEETTQLKPLVESVQLLSREDVSSLEQQRRDNEKAYDYFEDIYGSDTLEVMDFASRPIRENDFGRKDSEYGWNFVRLDENEPEITENLLIANIKTLKDFKRDVPFTTNGHTYRLVDTENGKKVRSEDTVSDPFDLEDTLHVAKSNGEKKVPLVYLFIKVIGAEQADVEENNMLLFFDLLDRTAKRCCPLSYLEMKTVVGVKANYAFLTFDGTVDGVYKEVIDYAMLVNSYRAEFRKQSLLNAILVVDEVSVPFSLRHMTFEKLIAETKDVDLLAIHYQLLMTPVIDSWIKRTIHIGPEILDKLPIDQNNAIKSNLGEGQFRQAYGFKGDYMVYNYGYTLKKKSEEEA